jgi:hypothetical protein
MTANRDRDDSAQQVEANDPMESAEHAEPIEPIARNEPTLPIDRMDPFEPIERIEFSDHRDQRDVSVRFGISVVWPTRRNLGTTPLLALGAHLRGGGSLMWIARWWSQQSSWRFSRSVGPPLVQWTM